MTGAALRLGLRSEAPGRARSRTPSQAPGEAQTRDLLLLSLTEADAWSISSLLMSCRGAAWLRPVTHAESRSSLAEPPSLVLYYRDYVRP